MANYTVSDILTVSAGTGLFALFAFLPGFSLGWALDLLGFRRRSLPEQLLMSTPISLALCPIVTYWLLRFVSITAVWVFYGGCAIGFVALLAMRIRFADTAWKPLRSIFLIMAGWVFGGLFLLIDLQIGSRLYFPTVAYDYNIRSAFVSAIARTGVPPANPLFFPGHPVPLHYHYFWLILCSLVHRLGAPTIGARQALIAGSLWSGISLLAMIPMYLRFFATGDPLAFGRRSRVGMGLLGVAGLQIFPTLILALAGAVYPSVGWDGTTTPWIGVALWVPHHLAALTACLLGFLILWDASRQPLTSRAYLRAAVVAGLTFATAAGTSIYVTLVFAIFSVSWLILNLVQRKPIDAFYVTVSGLSSLVFALPFLRELRGLSAGGPFVEFAVRPLAISILFLPPSWRGSWVNLQRLILLPFNYFLEFGFFLGVAILWCAKHRVFRRPLTREQWAGVLMVSTSVLVCTFLRSSSIPGNELGMRGLFVAQFMLLIWGVEIVEDWRAAGLQAGTASQTKSNKAVLKVLLVLGILGSVYEVAIVRSYTLLVDSGTLPYSMFSPDRRLGERTYALRRAYDHLKKISSVDAVLQYDPKVSFGDVFYGLYAERQTVVGDTGCGTGFGGDARLCPQMISQVDEIFEKPGAFTPAAVDVLCRKLSINYLVVKDTDGVWQDSNGWAFRSVPLIANPFARIYSCGQTTGSTTNKNAGNTAEDRPVLSQWQKDQADIQLRGRREPP